MKKRNYLKRIGLCLMASVVLLTGCGSEKAGSNVETEEAVNRDEEHIENEYRSTVLDRSLTEGQLAVYYLQGMERQTNYSESANSGDGILIITPNGKTMLIDTNVIANTAYIIHALQELGIEKLDYFVNTHIHVDHVSGFSTLVRNIEIGEIFTPPADAYFGEKSSSYVNTMYRKATEKGIKWSFMAEGDTLTLDEGIEIKVYNPPADLDWDSCNENEWSIAFRLIYGDSSYFFGGDIGNDLVKYGRDTINQMITKYGDELQTDIVKMNHHGGDNSQSNPQEWLDTVKAKLYVGTFHTVSYDVAYFRMAKTGADVLHTALDGTVVVYTTGDGTYDVQVEQDRYNTTYGIPDTVDGHMRIE